MKFSKINLNALAVLIIASAIILVDVHAAFAQSTRYWSRSVAPGKQIEFQWLNSDERTCKDNGYAKMVVERAPKLGKFRTVRRKFTQQEGRCKGKRFSVLLVYYVAGRRKGTDRANFRIQGGNNNNIRINLTVDVK